MTSAGGPPFAPELADVGSAPELVVVRHELVTGRREPECPPSSPGVDQDLADDGPPFAAELVTDWPPHLEELA